VASFPCFNGTGFGLRLYPKIDGIMKHVSVWQYIEQNHCVCRRTAWNGQLIGYSVILMRLTRKKWTRHLRQNHSIWMAKEVCIVLELKCHFYTVFNISLFI